MNIIKKVLLKRIESNCDFIIDMPKHYTYGEIIQSSLYCANNQIGSYSGNVLILSHSNAFWCVAFFACVLNGNVSFTLSDSLSDFEIIHYIHKTDVKLVLYEPAYDERILKLKNLCHINFKEINLNLAERKVSTFSNDNKTICYHITSGSSGYEKMVVRYDMDMYDEGIAVAKTLELQQEDILYITSPIFHSFGSGLFIASLLSCSKIILSAELDFQNIENVCRNKISIISGVPYFYKLLCKCKTDINLSTLRYAISGGDFLDESLYTMFRDRFGKSIIQEYGLSEAGIVCMNTGANSFSKSVGLPISGYKVKVVDDNMKELPKMKVGNIVISRKSLPKEYKNISKEKQSTFLSSQSVMSGDFGYIDKEGKVYLIARKKMMINIAGNKIAPREVEERLLSISGILEAYVFGISDKVCGENIAAVIASDKFEDEDICNLKKIISDKYGARYVPKIIKVVKKLCKNANGKNDKKRIESLINHSL